MRRLFCICLVATFFCTTQDARGEHSSQVNVNAFQAEGGGGEHKQRPLVASVEFSNPNGGSSSASGSVGPESETITTESGTVYETGRTILSMKAFATATGGSGDEEKYVSNVANATVYWEEDITFSRLPPNRIGPDPEPLAQILAYLRFMHRMSGSTSGDAHSDFNFSVAHGDKSVVQEKDLDAFDQDFENVPIFVFADDLEFTPSSIDGSIALHMSFSLDVMATGHGSAFGKPNTSTADFSHTASLVSITPFDADGNVIPGVVIQSSSGFDYNPLIVPEPSGAELTVGLWACVAGLRTRARRKQARHAIVS